jgi:hypothetical protein
MPATEWTGRARSEGLTGGRMASSGSSRVARQAGTDPATRASARRLVGEQQGGPVDPGRGRSRPLLLASRQLRGQRRGPFGGADRFEEFAGAGIAVEVHPAREDRDQHVVQHGEGGQQVEALEHEPDPAPVRVQSAALERHPVDLDHALVGQIHAADEVQDGGFPRPGRAHHRHRDRVLDVQVDPVEGGQPRVPACHPPQRHAHRG